jgi:hypothetical protein
MSVFCVYNYYCTYNKIDVTGLQLTSLAANLLLGNTPQERVENLKMCAFLNLNPKPETHICAIFVLAPYHNIRSFMSQHILRGYNPAEPDWNVRLQMLPAPAALPAQQLEDFIKLDFCFYSYCVNT